jgi:hypothetical protein
MGKLKHGMRHTRLYETFVNMKTRCYNSNNSRYKLYGGRGIKICDEWLKDFNTFYEWAIDHGYNDTLTIDRIDPDGDYEPSNCRWVTWQTQQNNRRNNHRISFNGQNHTLAEWSRITGINYGTLVARISRRGWSVERALTTGGDFHH